MLLKEGAPTTYRELIERTGIPLTPLTNGLMVTLNRVFTKGQDYFTGTRLTDWQMYTSGNTVKWMMHGPQGHAYTLVPLIGKVQVTGGDNQSRNKITRED